MPVPERRPSPAGRGFFWASHSPAKAPAQPVTAQALPGQYGLPRRAAGRLSITGKAPLQPLKLVIELLCVYLIEYPAAYASQAEWKLFMISYFCFKSNRAFPGGGESIGTFRKPQKTGFKGSADPLKRLFSHNHHFRRSKFHITRQ